MTEKTPMTSLLRLIALFPLAWLLAAPPAGALALSGDPAARVTSARPRAVTRPPAPETALPARHASGMEAPSHSPERGKQNEKKSKPDPSRRRTYHAY